MMGNINNRYRIDELIKKKKAALLNKVDSLGILSEQSLNDIIDDLVSEYSIPPIEFGNPRPSEPEEVFRTVNDGYYRQIQEKQYQVVVTIAITGAMELLECTPTRSTVVYLEEPFQLSNGAVQVTLILPSLDPGIYRQRLEVFLSKLQTNLPIVHEETAPWNSGVESLIRTRLAANRKEHDRKCTFMKEIGFDINPKSDEYLIPVQVHKKTIPKPYAVKRDSKKLETPTLVSDVYRDILAVLHSVGEALERKPSLYRSKHEEDLRDIFLLFLETRYDSATGVGEAFNKAGKTDILIKYAPDGSNIFVAECKFWRGSKALLSGIDQLLGYLTHRDSKAAMLVFVDRKGFTGVINTIESEVTQHSNFLTGTQMTAHHTLATKFSLPDDVDQSVEIEFLFFHFPKVGQTE